MSMDNTSGTPTDLTDRLAAAGARIEPVLEDMFPHREGDILSEAVWYHMGTGGKRVRPAICLLTCDQLGGDSREALPFAAAVEVLHNMLLVHDDVEDGDTVRRDRDTVWVKYGVPNAVNVGDYMLAAAYRAVGRSHVPTDVLPRLFDVYSMAFESTCQGQALDLNWRARRDFTVDDYLRLVTLKTGRYMALGMVGGALVAGATDKVVQEIQRLGEHMGAAFQIRDDLIDLSVGKGRGGVIGNDVREGKCSILYAHAISAANPAQAERLISIMARPREETTNEDVSEVQQIYAELGSVEFAQSRAEALAAQAIEVAEHIPVRDRSFFPEVTRFMVMRRT
jgi:geranylgeranyl pyrophosphate synthase